MTTVIRKRVEVSDVESQPAAGHWFALVAAILTLLYLPAVVAEFGFYDDHLALWESNATPGYFVDLMVSSGRPLNGLLTEPALLLIDSIAGLRWLRAIAVVGVLVTAWVIHRVGREAQFGSEASAGMALAVSVMPSVVVLATWAIAAWQLFAVAAGIGAGLLLARARHRGETLAATLLLAAALSIYQPAALAVVPAFLLITVAGPQCTGSFVRAAVAAVGAAVLYGASTYAAFSITGTHAADRAQLPTSVTTKATWFVEEVLPRTLDPLAFTPNPAVVILSAASLIVGVALLLRPVPVRTRISYGCALVTGWIVTCLPVLMFDANVVNHRLLIANHVMFVFMAALAARGFTSVVPSDRVAKAIVVLVGLTLAVGAFQLHRYVIDPRVEERIAVARMVGSSVVPGAPLYVRPADPDQTLAPARSFREFGWLTVADPLSAGAMVWLIAEEAPSQIVVTADEPPPDSAVLDFSEITDNVNPN